MEHTSTRAEAARPSMGGSLFLTAAIIVGGLLISAIAAWLVDRWQREHASAQFQAAALERIEAIRRGVETKLEVVHALAGLYAASEEVDEREFGIFTIAAMERHVGILALQWLPRVEHEARQVHETALGVRFSEWAGDAQVRPSGDREEYFPIWYVISAEPESTPLGFDLASQEDRAAAITQARDTGRLVVSAPLTLIQRPQGPPGVIAVAPVYAKGATLETLEGRRGAFLGVVGAVLVVENVVREAIGIYGLSRIDLHISDGIHGAESPLFAHLSGRGPRPERTTSEALVLESFRVGGRTWTVAASPAPTHPAVASRWEPWAVLVIGLLITSLLGLNVSTMVSRREARRLVSERSLELEESELRFRQMAEHIDSVFWLTSGHGASIDYVSPAFRRIWRRPAEDILHHPAQLLETVHPDDRRRVAELAARQGLLAYDVEYRILRPDGEIRWIRDRAVPATGPGGELGRAAGIAEDITDRKQAEAALRAGEERLRQVFQAVVDPVWDWDISADRTTFSPSWDLLLGYEPGELDRTQVTWSSLVHPDDRDRVAQALEQCLQPGGPERYETEYRLRTRTGDWKWVLSRGRVVQRDRAGRGVRMIGSIADITDRKQAEEALRQSEARHRAVLAAIPDCMFRMRADGTYVDYHAPPETPLLLPPEEFLGRRCPDVMPPHVAEPTMRAIRDALASGETHTFEYRASDDRPSRFWEVRVAPTGPEEVLAIVRDVSEQRLAEAALRRSEELNRRILEALPVGMVVVGADSAFRRANAQAESFLGLRWDELEQRLIADFEPETIHEDGSPMSMQEYPVVRSLASGRNEGPTVIGVRRPSGELRWGVFTAVPLMSPSDPRAVEAVVVLFVDITARKGMEEALRASEERYRIIAEQTGQLVYDYEVGSGDIVWVGAIEAVTGYTAREFAGIDLGRWEQLIHPEDRAEVVADLGRAVAAGRPFRSEYRLQRKDGRYIHVLDNGVTIPDAAGRPVRMLGTMQDITERRQAEEALRESEERYRLLAENATDMISRHAPDGAFRYASPACRTILGFEPEELLGRRVSQLVASEAAGTDEEIPGGRRGPDALLQSLGPEVTRYQVQRKDGEVVWLETTSRAVIDPESGRIEEIVAVSRDVTARMNADRALRASEERFRSLSTSSPIGIFMAAPDGGWTWSNPRLRDIGGFGPAEELGQGWARFVHEQDARWLLEEWSEYARSAQPYTCEFRLRRPDGSIRRVRAVTAPMFSDSGGLIGHVGSIEDITERKAAEDALRESEERYRRLVETSPDGIFVHRDGRFVFLNAEAARLFGAASPTALVGQEVARFARTSALLHTGLVGGPTQEATLARLDGSEFYADVAAAGCTYHGLPAVQVVARDITQRKEAEARLRFQASVLSQVDDAVIAVDPQRRLTYLNAAAAEQYGVEPEQALGRPLDEMYSRRWLDAADEKRWHEALETEGRWEGTSIHIKRNGEQMYAESAVSVLRDEAGNEQGLLAVIRDVTERVRFEQRQSMMMAELDHRVKNNLAAVLSIADQTLRSSRSMAEFSEAFLGRVRALARMHGVLAKTRWKGARLSDLARQSLEAFMLGDGRRVSIEGPEVMLPARAASPVSMALHELATNAAKYGALSVPTGHVDVQWSVDHGDGEPDRVRLKWQESGGPQVTPPERRGFGTELIEGGIAYELHGRVEIQFDPAGLVCEMEMPVEWEADRFAEELRAIESRRTGSGSTDFGS